MSFFVEGEKDYEGFLRTDQIIWADRYGRAEGIRFLRIDAAELLVLPKRRSRNRRERVWESQREPMPPSVS